ncbi:MAG: outer membrane beta-barrel protein [Acidobacteriota bacterium]
MFKKVILTVLVVAFTSVELNEALAQSAEKKFELGGQFTALHITTHGVPGSTAGFQNERTSDPGFGIRLGHNFTSYLALEAEGSFFPRDRQLEAGRKVQGLFGARVGKRFESVGVFAKTRPGFVRFSRGSYDGYCPLQIFPPPINCGFRPVAKTNFAADLGGVFEWYPSKNMIVRFDAGDTIIRFADRNVAVRDLSPGPVAFPIGVVRRAAETTHNFQGSIGVGWRF